MGLLRSEAEDVLKVDSGKNGLRVNIKHDTRGCLGVVVDVGEVDNGDEAYSNATK